MANVPVRYLFLTRSLHICYQKQVNKLGQTYFSIFLWPTGSIFSPYFCHCPEEIILMECASIVIMCFGE